MQMFSLEQCTYICTNKVSMCRRPSDTVPNLPDLGAIYAIISFLPRVQLVHGIDSSSNKTTNAQ